jgi:hypothetical protein
VHDVSIKLSPNYFIYPLCKYPYFPKVNSKLLSFKPSKMHLLGERMPNARYGEILLVPSKIGEFLD